MKYFGSFRENDDMLIIGNDIMKEINFSEVKHNKNRRFNTKNKKQEQKKINRRSTPTQYGRIQFLEMKQRRIDSLTQKDEKARKMTKRSEKDKF